MLNLDLCFVDPGIAPCESETAPRLLSNAWAGLWFRASNERFQKIRLELADSGTVVENVPGPPHGGCVVSVMLKLDTVRHPTCRCVIKHFVLSG
ncbi:MAG: hypothetical protein ACLQVX_15905 [Limisphaerales bacterium]